MKECKSIIGERLAQLMRENGNISQTKLARTDESGVTQSVICNILNSEDYRPQSDTIIKLCRYFDVTSDYLLGLSDIKSTSEDKKIAMETIGITDESFKALRNLFNFPSNDTPGVFWDEGVAKSVKFFLENEERSFPIINLIWEYLYADFDKIYYYPEGDVRRRRQVQLVQTDALRLPMTESEWAENPADPIGYRLSKEHFSLMLLQIINEQIMDWRKKVQTELEKRSGK